MIAIAEFIRIESASYTLELTNDDKVCCNSWSELPEIARLRRDFKVSRMTHRKRQFPVDVEEAARHNRQTNVRLNQEDLRLRPIPTAKK